MDGGTKTRWSRVEALFQEAVEMDPARREVFVLKACAGDSELRAELDSLLASSEMTLSGLADSAANMADRLLSNGQESLTRIGAYRLIRTLGDGGMGTVYLGARDDDQYNRMVAIKVLRAGLSHRPELQHLFRTERQILADFDHPNIARMLDGGITPLGSPYLVMEYIDGIALDLFCQQRKLSLDARMRLFRTLCSAVDYAHRHLVIHRDIKPLNVLVTKDGTPKLLDFGIAKLVDPYQSAADQTLVSGNEQMLTPDYASPEQLLGRPVSTATDVYAVGILLFELLSGELPFSGSRTDPTRQARAIQEDEPEKTSVVCLRTGHLSPADARRIRGDVDSIIQKCLRKQPAQRYASASELLLDLDRYFAGHPVEAAEQSIPYRARKFIGRHRLGTVFTAFALLLIVSFAAAMAVLARQASRGEALARREEQFLASIFKAATPEGSQGKDVTARQLLDQAAARLGTELASDPSLQAEMTENIGQSYVALGLYNRAQPLLERALRLTAQTHGQTNADYSEDLENLGTALRLEGEYQQAEPLFRQTAALNQKLFGPNSFAFAHSLSNLGECLYLEDKDAEAERTLRQALAIERPMAMNQQDGTRSYLALTIERRGAYPEAAQLLREATAISAQVEGKESADYLIGLHNLAGAQIDMGDLNGAIISDSDVLAIRRKIWGPQHPDTAYSLNNLGWIYLEQGKWELAAPLLKENLEIMQKLSPTPLLRYTTSLANWGRVLEQKGDYAGANDVYIQAMKVVDTNGLSQSWTAAKIEIYQAMLALDRGDVADGTRISTDAIRIETELGGDRTPMLSAGLLTAGLADLLSSDPDGAERCFRHALAIREQTYPSGHPERLLAQVRLAEALLAGGKLNEALEVITSATGAARSMPFPMPAWRMAELEMVHGLVLRGLGEKKEGEALIAEGTPGIRNYNQAAVKDYLLHAASDAVKLSRAF